MRNLYFVDLLEHGESEVIRVHTLSNSGESAVATVQERFDVEHFAVVNSGYTGSDDDCFGLDI